MKELKNTNDLPEGWIWVTIAELGVVVSGGTPSTRISQFWEGDIAWITPADLSGFKGKFISNGKRNLTRLGLENSSAFLLPANTLIYSTRAPIGYCAITRDSLATNQGFKSLIPLASTNIDYVFYYLLSAKQVILEMASGTTFLELSLSNFNKIPIPLPPFEEQKRIVSKIEEYLSELDKAVKTLNDTLIRLNLYKQLILNNAFEGKVIIIKSKRINPAQELVEKIQKEKEIKYIRDLAEFKEKLNQWRENKTIFKRPVRPSKPQPYINITDSELNQVPKLPTSWKWEKIGNLAFVTKLAGFEFTEFITYSEVGQIPVIKAQNVSKSGFIESNFSYVPESVLSELPRIKITGGEILFVFVGAGLGNVAIVPFGQQYLLGPNVALIKPSDEIDNKYIQYFLTSPVGKANIASLSKATAQGSISMENIRNILVPLCAFSEQKNIVQYIDYQFTIVDHLKDTVHKILKKAETLKIGILKSAFEGKLVPQRQDDPHATKLFSKLLEEKIEYLSKQKKANNLKPKKKHFMAELKSVLEILKQSNKPISARELWQESIHKDDIDAFYAELKILEERITVINNDHHSSIYLNK